MYKLALYANKFVLYRTSGDPGQQSTMKQDNLLPGGLQPGPINTIYIVYFCGYEKEEEQIV